MELGLYTSISESINFQLECQASTLYHHLEREIEVVEFHTAGGGQPSEQTLGDRTKICCQGTHILEIPRVGRRRFSICIRGDEVV